MACLTEEPDGVVMSGEAEPDYMLVSNVINLEYSCANLLASERDMRVVHSILRNNI